MGIDERFEQERKWLESLKVGDEVVVNWSFSHSLATVTHATPTQIHVGSSKYRRKNGYGCGSHRGSIRMPTQDIRDEIEKEQLAGKLSNLYRSEVKRMSLDQLRRIVAIMEETPPEPAR